MANRRQEPAFSPPFFLDPATHGRRPHPLDHRNGGAKRSTKRKVRKQASELLDSIERIRRYEFKRTRGLHYNHNTKGYAYEKALRDLLDIYLGGVYDFHLRASIIDYKLEYLSVFKQGENEFI